MSNSRLKIYDPRPPERVHKQFDDVNQQLDQLRTELRVALSRLFQSNQRADELANALGYHDVYQAHSAVVLSHSHSGITYRTAIERSQRRDKELKEEIAINRKLRERIRTVEHERDKLKDQSRLLVNDEDSNSSPLKDNLTALNGTEAPTTPPSKRIQHLVLQLSALRAKYDDLSAVNRRAAEHYEKNYRKWRAFKEWIFDDDTENKRDQNKRQKTNETPANMTVRKTRNNENLMKKRHMLLNMGPSLAKLEQWLESDADADKENDDVQTPKNTKKRRLETEASLSSPASTLRSLLPTDPVPSSTTTIRLATSPAITPSMPSLQTMAASSSRMPQASTANLQNEMRSAPSNASVRIPCSSDTEDDSQAPDPVYSDHPLPQTRPIPLQRRESRGPNIPNSRSTLDKQSLESNIQLAPAGESSGKGNRHHPQAPAGIESLPEREEPNKTPLQRLAVQPGTSDRCAEDYTAFKGRGRYAENPSAAKDTINVRYAIDPDKNGGCDFQYDEVIRGKKERQKMHAGDCECCRDYYEAVGQLPKRLQPPPWRSPSPPRRQRDTGPRGSVPQDIESTDVERERAIAAHKQEISRHRFRWERASTPPGYWNIGFPTTQEAEDINERAAAMHRAKIEKVEGEIRRGEGRYRKR